MLFNNNTFTYAEIETNYFITINYNNFSERHVTFVKKNYENTEAFFYICPTQNKIPSKWCYHDTYYNSGISKSLMHGTN